MLRTIEWPLGTGLLLLGQTDAAQVLPYGDLILQAGALGVLTWAVWHAYNNLIPGLRKEIMEDRNRYTESLDRLNVGFQKTLDTMADRHERTETATADRHERWESQRHADSEKLESALTTLSATCAKARARFDGPTEVKSSVPL
jgi:hypothetical protein